MTSKTSHFWSGKHASERLRVAHDSAFPPGPSQRFVARKLVILLQRPAVILPAGGVALALMSPAAFAQLDPACNATIAAQGACQIIYNDSGSSAGHGDTGPSPSPINVNFTSTQTLTATATGWGAVQFETYAGSGGAADSDGGHGGGGGAGSSVSSTVGSTTTAQGANAGGILRFTSVGGNGGPGQGDHKGSPGVGGTGGSGGAVNVTVDGSVTSSDASSPGLYVLSQGGSSIESSRGGGTDFFGPLSGDGGTSGQITVNIGGTVSSVATGASINAQGGDGGTGVNDTGGTDDKGRAGGNGGGTTASPSAPVNVTLTGRVTSSAADGVDVLASGGNGGIGGNSSTASNSSQAGNGGNGGNAAPATLTISGSASGAVTGASVKSNGGTGGNGGTSGNSPSSVGGSGGNGGNGAGTTLTLQSGSTITGGVTGATAVSMGGNGGMGGGTDLTQDSSEGGAGGVGGAGGTVSVVIGQAIGNQPATTTTVSGAQGAAVIGVSSISYGGAGGAAESSLAVNYTHGGNGGNGGTAGQASVTLQSVGVVQTLGNDTPKTSTAILPGVLVRSNGGAGGNGGNTGAGMGSQAGDAGFAGNGNTATAIIDGTVSTSGSFAYGVLAQSIGGAGAGGGDADGVFGSHGGKARNGGAGAQVYLSGQGGSVTTTGTGAAAMVAQSIGGGGGAGGNASNLGGGAAIGGNGGAGGAGANVTVGLLATDSNSALLNDTLITRGDSSTALIAQSVGGAGGNGGNALTIGTALPSLAIGGDGAAGGIGGVVNVQNDGLVTTTGLQSGGIVAQSVGGGGGNGGAGVAINGSVQVSTSFALGGSGGVGGTGGIVNLTNNDQITTYGADSYGLKAQSVGGGGGQGGSALATAIALGGDPDIPTVAVSISIGGSGGAGGNQGSTPVVVTNNGLITTAGDGAIGIIAQSVAGGGGNGGDSTASSYANGGDDGTNITASSSIGGSSKAGGTGGAVTVNNNGLIVTKGADAYGVYAQSVGGGGGVGGTGDSSASAAKGGSSYAGTLTVGGAGGLGGDGGTVTVNTSAQGNIATSGDGANAILAQSIGGGGGASGGGTAKASGGNLSVGVTVGGNAGNGGVGNTVTVTTQSTLLTKGAEADAIFAQSVGGGGGKAGKGASTAGGTQDAQTVVADLSATIANGLNLDPQGVTKIADGVYKVGDAVWKGITKLSDLQTILTGGSSLSASLRDDDDSTASNLKLNATIGGQGGSGGNGGQVKVTNSGAIETDGTKSDGIFAQSVGGGGGVGGASSFSGSQTSGGSDSGSTSGSLKVGGNGAAAGLGNTVTVTNTGAITTNAVTAYGINAQSVGGGGGKGGATAASSGTLKDFSATLGGSGGTGGTGGAVLVTNDALVTTNERQSIAILAQSAGGGGGTAHLLSSDIGTSTTGNNMQIDLTIGGSGGAGGDGGTATVQLGSTVAGTVLTNGTGGIGIVAQSIGGGGGVLTTTSTVADAQGGGNGGGIQDSTLIPIKIGDTGGASGNGNTVAVTLGLNTASWVTTNGAGAYGILAQSVGGGGGLFAGATPATELAKLYGSTGQTGNGGAVNVTLNNHGGVVTNGSGAVGVFAQSVGGGGGVIGGMQNVNLASGLQTNPTAETGQGGNVTVAMSNTAYIYTYGAGAHGILAQAFGGGGGVVAGAGNTGYAYAGATPYTNCTGTACTGSVNVTLNSGARVLTNGVGAWGIYVQSQGNGLNDTTVYLGPNSWVESWKDSAGAIFVDGAGTNTVTNYGVIDDGSCTANPADCTTGAVPNKSQVAIGGAQVATVDNHGKIYGAIDLPGGSVINNYTSATLSTERIDLGGSGQLTNAGTIDAAGAGIGTLRINANLVQQPTGKMVVDLDSNTHRNDLVQVSGNATLAGTLLVRPTSLSPTSFTVAKVGGTTDASALTATDTGGGRLFGYGVSATGSGTGTSIDVKPYARLDASAASYGGARAGVAGHLQRGFTEGMSASQGTLYAQLASLPSQAAYRLALDNISGEVIQATAVAAHAASLGFYDRMNSCPALDGQGGLNDMAREKTCGWVRALGNDIDRKTSDSAAGFDASVRMVQAGGQKEIGEGWLIGGSIASQNSDIRASDTGGKIDGNGVSVGLIVKRELGPWLLSGGIDFGRGSYDSQRTIALGNIVANAKGDFDMSHLGLHGRVAYRIQEPDWYMKPYVDVHAVRMHSSAFSETGAGDLNLQVQGNNPTFFSISPMFEFGKHFALDNGLRLQAFAGVGALLHDQHGLGAQSQLQGVGATPFEAYATLPNRQAKLNLGIEVSRKNASLRIEYGGEFASGYRSRTASVKLNMLF